MNRQWWYGRWNRGPSHREIYGISLDKAQSPWMGGPLLFADPQDTLSWHGVVSHIVTDNGMTRFRTYLKPRENPGVHVYRQLKVETCCEAEAGSSQPYGSRWTKTGEQVILD